MRACCHAHMLSDTCVVRERRASHARCEWFAKISRARGTCGAVQRMSMRSVRTSHMLSCTQLSCTHAAVHTCVRTHEWIARIAWVIRTQAYTRHASRLNHMHATIGACIHMLTRIHTVIHTCCCAHRPSHARVARTGMIQGMQTQAYHH